MYKYEVGEILSLITEFLYEEEFKVKSKVKGSLSAKLERSLTIKRKKKKK